MTNQSHLPVTPTGSAPVPSIRLIARERERVISALDDNRVGLYYQPVVRADSGKFVAFHEALARIFMPNGDVVAAGQFMPFVDNTDIGARLDLQTIRLALETLEAYPDMRLSVNMSVHSMAKQDWLNMVKQHETLVRERLIVEITETGAMHNVDQTIGFLNEIHKLGAAVAVDDFGTGNTSFRYFRDFRFDMLKIDGLFIRDIAHNKDYRVLVDSLVRICQHFDMFSVAEFIETEEDANVARQLGIDCLQGYLIGKPMETPAFVLQSWSDGARNYG